MVLAEHQRDTDIHHREAGQRTVIHRLTDALLDSRDELPWHHAADDLVHELEAAAAVHRLNFEIADAVLADPSISGASAAPGQDGVCNLLKYAFALNPWETNSSALPKVGEWTDPDTQLSYLTLTYRQNMQAEDLEFMPQAADDLKENSWTTGLEEIARTTDTDCDVVTVRDTVPISSANQRFLRIIVSPR